MKAIPDTGKIFSLEGGLGVKGIFLEKEEASPSSELDESSAEASLNFLVIDLLVFGNSTSSSEESLLFTNEIFLEAVLGVDLAYLDSTEEN